MRRKKNHHSTAFGAVVIALFGGACGSEGARPGLHFCYQPSGSNEVCLQTVSHRRSMGDVVRGSPGITGRIYGKQGQDIVELTQMTGGPQSPADWCEQHGDPADYLAQVDVAKVTAAFHAEEVPRKMQKHKDFLGYLLDRLATLKRETPGVAADVPAHAPDAIKLNVGAARLAQRAAVSEAVDADEIETWHQLDTTPADDDPDDGGRDPYDGDQAEDAADGRRFVGSFGSTANRGNRPKFGHAGEIYREKVEVFAETFLWGIHSGTITTVYPQVDGVWKYYRDWPSCNHGACPGSKKMEFRFACAPDVATFGWYGLDGECANRWGPAGKDHFCNDDTALQINNAFGRWSGNYCANTHRTHAPRCEVQW